MNFVKISIWFYQNWKKVAFGIGAFLLVIILIIPDKKKGKNAKKR